MIAGRYWFIFFLPFFHGFDQFGSKPALSSLSFSGEIFLATFHCSWYPKVAPFDDVVSRRVIFLWANEGVFRFNVAIDQLLRMDILKAADHLRKNLVFIQWWNCFLIKRQLSTVPIKWYETFFKCQYPKRKKVNMRTRCVNNRYNLLAYMKELFFEKLMSRRTFSWFSFCKTAALVCRSKSIVPAPALIRFTAKENFVSP